MIEKVLEQYKSINGIKNLKINDLHDEKIKEEIKKWLELRQKYGYRYLDFIYEMKQNILEKTTAEVGKTELDSLVIPFDTTIISPHEFYDLEDRERLIQSRFIVYDEKPILYFDISDSPRQIVIQEKRIDTFMTENPYTPYSISNWEGLHNSGNFDIVVGMYGDIHDKNIKDNLEMLKKLREKIVNDDYKFDYNSDGDIYFIALASNRKTKTLGSKLR